MGVDYSALAFWGIVGDPDEVRAYVERCYPEIARRHQESMTRHCEGEDWRSDSASVEEYDWHLFDEILGKGSAVEACNLFFHRRRGMYLTLRHGECKSDVHASYPYQEATLREPTEEEKCLLKEAARLFGIPDVEVKLYMSAWAL